MSYALEALSPELVLVSPDLARQARAQLPDRPWEAFVPVHPVALGVPLRLAAAPASATVPAPVAAPAAAAPTRSRGRFRPPLGLTLLLGFVAIVLAGSLLPARDAPTLGPPPVAPSPKAPTPPAGRRPAVHVVRPTRAVRPKPSVPRPARIVR
jgi:hypothetical protein